MHNLAAFLIAAFSVLTQTIARALDLDDDRVAKEPVQEGRGHTGSPKTSPHSARPRLEVRMDHCAFFVAGLTSWKNRLGRRE